MSKKNTKNQDAQTKQQDKLEKLNQALRKNLIRRKQSKNDKNE